MGLVGLAMLGLAIGVAVLAPWLAPYDPETTVRVTIDDIYARPSAAHLLGTDDGGKDVLSALVYGARVSLVVGFAASLISMLIGWMLGGPRKFTRTVLATISSIRNVALAMAIAIRSFPDPAIIAPLLAFAAIMVPDVVPANLVQACACLNTFRILKAGV